MTERHILVAYTRPVQGAEEAYNNWYNDTHLSEVLKVKGFQAVQRFALAEVIMNASDTPCPYLAIYEIVTDDIAGALADLRSALPYMTISEALDQTDVSLISYRPIGDRVTIDER